MGNEVSSNTDLSEEEQRACEQKGYEMVQAYLNTSTRKRTEARNDSTIQVSNRNECESLVDDCSSPSKAQSVTRTDVSSNPQLDSATHPSESPVSWGTPVTIIDLSDDSEVIAVSHSNDHAAPAGSTPRRKATEPLSSTTPTRLKTQPSPLSAHQAGRKKKKFMRPEAGPFNKSDLEWNMASDSRKGVWSSVARIEKFGTVRKPACQRCRRDHEEGREEAPCRIWSAGGYKKCQWCTLAMQPCKK